MKLDSLRLAASALVMSAALSGCYVAPIAPAPAYYGGGAVVAAAPPPVQYEAIGVAPYPGALWIGGSWFWAGGRYVWRGGYWERPRPGYRWVAHGWVRGPAGWREAPGHWERR